MPDTSPLAIDANALEEATVQIPGATPGGVFAKLINTDAGRGVVASVIRLAPGTLIPAHVHAKGAEAHYVLEGELIDAGTRYGPGAYLTHAAGVVHGPHESPGGCTVLTVQTAPLDADDHKLA